MHTSRVPGHERAVRPLPGLDPAIGLEGAALNAQADERFGGHPAEERPKVLLVDDEPVALMLTALALRERGFDITEVASGEAALRLLIDQPHDMVVLDALMPQLDGFATCRQLRAMAGFENLPVLMLTGLDDEASIARAYEVGATDFFVKSTQWSLLAGRLRYLLRSSRTRQELERHKAKLARAQDLARMGSFDWRLPNAAHPSGLTLSPEGRRVFGLSPDQPITLRQLVCMVVPQERRGAIRILRGCSSADEPLAEDITISLPDYRSRVLHVEAEPDYNEQGHLQGFTGIVQDVTERRMAEDRIRHLANFDGLTGLPNRRQLMWRTERALDHARRGGHLTALLLIDLDRFKVINDTLGHGPGDELLLEVARRLRSCVRHSDQVTDGTLEAAGLRSHRSLEAVGRLGGDEFVALLPEVIDARDAARVSERMLGVLREPITVGGQECFVTCSIGVSLFPRDGQTVADLMRNADVAMYSAKNAGRNTSMVYSPLLVVGRGREKLVMETALHKALERDELVLHYQPQVDVRSGTMVGIEALMRWRHGDKLVPPNDFIPAAEETGLIGRMSEWALHEAAHQWRRWSEEFGYQHAISVNLTARMFERGDLSALLRKVLTSAGVPWSALQLEITETGLMKQMDAVLPALQDAIEQGVQLSIDDFGTGYSSLAYLTSLPITELKIDRSFVRQLGSSTQSSAVVNAIIALARSLGLRVVAEGVENLGQMNELYRLGCHVMQGYLFSQPMPSQKVALWCAENCKPERFGLASVDERWA